MRRKRATSGVKRDAGCIVTITSRKATLLPPKDKAHPTSTFKLDFVIIATYEWGHNRNQTVTKRTLLQSRRKGSISSDTIKNVKRVAYPRPKTPMSASYSQNDMLKKSIGLKQHHTSSYRDTQGKRKRPALSIHTTSTRWLRPTMHKSGTDVS